MRTDPYAFFRNLDLFVAERHLPFRWDSPGSVRAALMVHGFPGTPADMRPLATVLHEQGWTVQAPLLPGFGPQIASLPQRGYREWVAAAQEAFDELQRAHERVVVVGHSLGASVALLSGVARPPAAQVLLAPYWRFVGRWQNAFWPLLRLWARRWRPLAMADFTDERVRIGIRRILPDLDLDNEGVRTELRDFIVPTRLLDELRKLGGATARTARRSSAPTLIVQGLRDGLVRPHDTELLAALIPSARLELLDATHNVTEPTDGAWDRVRRNVLEFLDNTGAASQL